MSDHGIMEVASANPDQSYSAREIDQELVPSYADEDPAQLKQRFEELGYLYLKQAVPATLAR